MQPNPKKVLEENLQDVDLGVGVTRDLGHMIRFNRGLRMIYMEMEVLNWFISFVCIFLAYELVGLCRCRDDGGRR